LACQILDFVGSQIKVGQFISIVEILTRFFRCWLGTQNLNLFVLIYKNCPNDPCFDCETFVVVKSFFMILGCKNRFFRSNWKEFENQSNHYVEFVDTTYFDF